MKIPIDDIDKWRNRFITVAPSVVLREIARAYSANRSALGFMLSDLHANVSSEEVVAVWRWDLERNGRGFTDGELDTILTPLQQQLRGGRTN